jgi:Dehydratase medium subunit
LTEPLVLAFLTETAPASALAAGFEEEGVPLEIVVKEGSPEALAREAARRAALGLGIGGDRDRLVVALAAFPGRPYLEAKAADARAMGHDAARLAARRPLGRPLTGAEGV